MYEVTASISACFKLFLPSSEISPTFMHLPTPYFKHYTDLMIRKWNFVIAISVSGDGDKVDVSFYRSPLSFEIATEITVSRHNPLLLSAERWQAFSKSLYL